MDYFSNTLLKTLQTIFLIGNTQGGVRLGITNQKFYVHSSKLCCFNAIILSAHAVFTAVRTVQVKINASPIPRHFRTGYSFTMIGFMGLVVVSIVTINAKSTAALMNRLIKWVHDFNSTWIKPEYEKDETIGRFLNQLFIFLITIGTTCPFLTCFHHYVFPDTPSYFTSLVDDPSLFLHVASTFSLMFLVKIYLATVIPLCDAALMYFLYVLPVITSELKAGRLNYKTKDALRSPYILACEFRKLEVLHKLCVEVLGVVFLPFQFFIGQIGIYASYTIVKDLDHLDITFIMFSFYCLAAWVIILECSGTFCKNSEYTIKSWRYLKCPHHKSKYVRRFRKSCRPLEIGTRGYYSITRLSILKFIQGTSKGTLRITLTLT